jgi:hypothetical protein
MDVLIQEVVSRVRAVDGAGLSDQTLRHIVEAVLEAVEQKRERGAQVAQELSVRGLSGGDNSMG